MPAKTATPRVARRARDRSPGGHRRPRPVDHASSGPPSATGSEREPRQASGPAPGEAQPPASQPRSSDAAARVGYIVGVVGLMLAFLGWLLYQWVDYLHGGQLLACIFGIVLLGVGAAGLSFAHHG